jgi:Transposase IS66 family
LLGTLQGTWVFECCSSSGDFAAGTAALCQAGSGDGLMLWTDDTPVTVLSSGEEGSRTGRFWTYIAEEHPYSVYDFTESRARDGPVGFLRGFAGYHHADAYAGYDQIYLGSNSAIQEVACWAHARRNFFDAMLGSPRIRTRSWSGSDSCTMSRSGHVECRPTHGVRSV